MIMQFHMLVAGAAQCKTGKICSQIIFCPTSALVLFIYTATGISSLFKTLFVCFRKAQETAQCKMWSQLLCFSSIYFNVSCKYSNKYTDVKNRLIIVKLLATVCNCIIAVFLLGQWHFYNIRNRLAWSVTFKALTFSLIVFCEQTFLLYEDTSIRTADLYF